MNDIKDYTKHAEGLYEVEVKSHTTGEAFGDPVMELHCEIIGKRVGDRLDGFVGDANINVTVRMTTKMWWLFEKTLDRLQFDGTIRDIYTEPNQKSDYFAGQRLVMECRHSISRDGSKKNEYWGIPTGNLARLSEEKLDTLDAMLAESRAKKEAAADVPYVATDDDVPY